MLKIKDFWDKHIGLGILIICILFSLVLLGSVRKVNSFTSSDDYCMSCHVHTESDMMWKLSSHHDNRTGVTAHCIDCHLPPKENGLAKYTFAKVKHGFKDVYGYLFKDSTEFDWELKSQPEIAEKFVYEDGCKKCHQNLYPSTLSDKGCEAHLRYQASEGKKSCISCHISVGHYNPAAHGANFYLAKELPAQIYRKSFFPGAFENFTEKIPGTGVSFNMVAIPGGRFEIGSNTDEDFRRKNEGPVREVQVDSFWIAEIEVSWDEYLAFFSATSSEGRKERDYTRNGEVDGITGPTPPWGAPDQGWGKGNRPAITMTHYAAKVYCRWLSEVTGKDYRLPTEAEWEYAARGNTTGTYFFEGKPKDFERIGLFNKWFGPDTSLINTYVVYNENSPHRSQDPSRVKANPYGLKNMLGNVAEFCLDYFDPNIYSKYPKGLVKNPFGPRKGSEHVVRGGAFNNTAADLRIARRDYTRTKDWLVTDPQMPKSIWWYSDCKHVGFRVVCVLNNKSLKEVINYE